MILKIRYSHVRDLFEYYAVHFNDEAVKGILLGGIKSKDDASKLGWFAWKMVDQMAEDRENNVEVLGYVDHGSVLPDIAYEMDLLMSKEGYSELWDKISDEA